MTIELLKTPEAVNKLKERGHDIIAGLLDISAAEVQLQYSLGASLAEAVPGLKKDNCISWKGIFVGGHAQFKYIERSC